MIQFSVKLFPLFVEPNRDARRPVAATVVRAGRRLSIGISWTLVDCEHTDAELCGAMRAGGVVLERTAGILLSLGGFSASPVAERAGHTQTEGKRGSWDGRMPAASRGTATVSRSVVFLIGVFVALVTVHAMSEKAVCAKRPPNPWKICLNWPNQPSVCWSTTPASPVWRRSFQRPCRKRAVDVAAIIIADAVSRSVGQC